jgi:hypothetical protein
MQELVGTEAQFTQDRSLEHVHIKVPFAVITTKIYVIGGACTATPKAYTKSKPYTLRGLE